MIANKTTNHITLTEECVIGIYLTCIIYYFILFRFIGKLISSAVFISSHSKKCVANYKFLLKSMLCMILAVIVYVVIAYFLQYRINISSIINILFFAFLGMLGVM